MEQAIHQITFSPTGGTRRVSELLSAGFKAESTLTELCTPKDGLKYPSIAADDLVVISMPVFAGRVPALAVERLRHIEANGAKCVIVAVYGNRAYDDALVEMEDVATEMGFHIIAAVAANAEHSIVRKYGAGRPDATDAADLKAFAS
ncbi:MAG: 4Fe-4S ferredoxin, partial [Sodaliphilus sp.]|nr:4Fe-4S ferredoxin [Sodaliphilus sp.]